MIKEPNSVLISISEETRKRVPPVYKAVFSGHPWHEDKICKNSLAGRCNVQYTLMPCDRYDVHRQTAEVSNDCRGSYKQRIVLGSKEGIVLLPREGLETCVGCGEKLELIEFYPEFCNHNAIIEEAVQEPGFIGYLAQVEDRLVGFTWGYRVPEKRTQSVAFPTIRELLVQAEVDPERTFYAAETGIIDDFQGKGVLWPLVGQRLLDANSSGNTFLITRTINPSVHGYLTVAFSGKEGKALFKDPERSSSWFAWSFGDFDENAVRKKIESSKAKSN